MLIFDLKKCKAKNGFDFKNFIGKRSDIDIFITFAYLYTQLANTDGRKGH